MIKYRVSGNNPPEKIEIISETAHFVTYAPVGVDWNGVKRTYNVRTERKITAHDYWCDTFEEGKEHMIVGATNTIESLEKQLERAKEVLEAIKLLKEEECLNQI